MKKIEQPRWNTSLLVEGREFDEFWRIHTGRNSRSLLFVLRKGFDPRMCDGLEKLLKAIHSSTAVAVLVLEVLDESDAPRETEDALAEDNWSRLNEVFKGDVKLLTLDGLSSTSQAGGVSHEARRVFSTRDELFTYTDIIIDISAMPRTVFFPMLARVLHFHDNGDCFLPNVHLIVTDNPGFDASIIEEGVDEQAHFIASFGGRFEEEGIATPRVWIPILGEKKLTQFGRIFDLVKPDEVCGVLPSPALNPRRADNIVLEYRRPLFDELNMDPRDFLYASETNPFDLYLQLRSAILHYHDVFRVVGGCRVAVSALSSKLMSVGVFLAAYELTSISTERSVGVAHVGCQRQLTGQLSAPSKVYSIYLAGEYYKPIEVR